MLTVPTKATVHPIKEAGLAATDICPYGKHQTMSHNVTSYPLTKWGGWPAAIALS